MLRRTIQFALVAALVVPAATTDGEIETRTVEYTDGETVLEGYLAYDDEIDGERPGVLVVHEWYGLNDFARLQTRRLAKLGYVAFAADIYGKGRRAETSAEAAELSGKFRNDRKLLRRRAQLALAELKKQGHVDDDSTGAIGFCFGGMTVLELARSGADVRAVVSFHGGLDTPDPDDAENIRGTVLVCHGAEDPHAPKEQVMAFWKEMSGAEVDWQMNVYGGAVHSFTNPDSGDDPSDGSAYNRQAAERAWRAMKLLFTETIGLPNPAGEGGVVRFAEENIAEPVGKAGKATGEAVKKAAEWTWDKVTGDD